MGADEELVAIERDGTGGGAVTVRVHYRRKDCRDTLVSLLLICCVALTSPCLVMRMTPPYLIDRWMLAGLTLFAFIPVVVLAASSAEKARRRYTIRAEPAALTVQSDGPFGARTHFYPRSWIRDVRLRFGEGRSARATAKLIVVPRQRWKLARGHLGGIGSDVLVKVADALREGLELPPRSWP